MANKKDTILRFLQDYSRVSTIGGLAYVFREDYSLKKKIFWTTIILWLVLLGIYWAVSIYLSWMDNQVLVSIKSASKYKLNCIVNSLVRSAHFHIHMGMRLLRDFLSTC